MNTKELFVVECADGEWIDSGDNGGFSVYTNRAEAQDALDSESDCCEEESALYKIVRFVREEHAEAIPAQTYALPVTPPAQANIGDRFTCPYCACDFTCIGQRDGMAQWDRP